MDPRWIPNQSHSGMQPNLHQNIPVNMNLNMYVNMQQPSQFPPPTNSGTMMTHQSLQSPAFNTMSPPPPPPPPQLFGYHAANNAYMNWHSMQYAHPNPSVNNFQAGINPPQAWNPNNYNPSMNPGTHFHHTKKRQRPPYGAPVINGNTRFHKLHTESTNGNTNDNRTRKGSENDHGAKVSKDKEGNKQDGSYRDLITSKKIIGKLGATLPGESRQEIDKWIAERKRKWPSRKNVEQKLADIAKRKAEREQQNQSDQKRLKKEKGIDNGLAAIANDYSSSDDDNSKTNNKKKQKGTENDRNNKNRAEVDRHGKKGRVQKKNKKRNKKPKGKNGPVLTIKPTRRVPLLKQLLNTEIQQEQATLLQAFRYLLQQHDKQ